MFDIKSYTIPTRPGCYLYKDSKGNVIYVGKAKQLNKRVSQYFQKSERLDPKTRLLVTKIRDVEFITTTNEVEALLLEQSLIHKYQPKFNIDLKGSIRYAYIKITDELYPRIITTRKVDENGTYYGPYVDGTMRRQVIGTLIKLFKIRTCVKLPKKVCLQYHLGNCQGPCENHIGLEEYRANIKNAERLLKGETKEMIEDIRNRMNLEAKNRNYEQAKLHRDLLEALSFVQEKQHIDQAKTYDQDVVNWIEKEGKTYFQIFNVLRGVITSRHKFAIETYPGLNEDFIRHYYSINYIPEEIVIPRQLEDQEVIEQYLRARKQEKFAYRYLPVVSITVPQKGVKKELLNLVKQNLEINVGLEPGLLELQQKLNLKNAPVTIDCFDVSNLKNQYIVGACIRLVNGNYHKNLYRKFKIKWQTGQDDVSAMREIIYRRYADAMSKGEELPDLICLDGGRGQLNAGIQAMAQLHLTFDICSLAKREEEIYLPGTPVPLRLNRKLPGIKILIKGRDEVHRFVLAYNTKLRKEIFK